MKKLLLLSLVALTLMACPPDDDTPPPANETSIIGTWKYLESFENGVRDENDLCDTEETLIYTENGDFSLMAYDDESTAGTCELVFSANGTWTNAGNTLSMTVNGETEIWEITFNGDTFSYEETDTEDGETIVYKDVFIKQ